MLLIYTPLILYLTTITGSLVVIVLLFLFVLQVFLSKHPPPVFFFFFFFFFFFSFRADRNKSLDLLTSRCFHSTHTLNDLIHYSRL